MVSAVFHTPLPAHAEAAPVRAEAAPVRAEPTPAQAEPVDAPRTTARLPFDWRALWLRVVPPLLGLGLLVLLWQVIAQSTGSGIPSPALTWDAAVKLFSDPFYSNGPNDQGIGWNVLSSLQRVGMGFGMAALVGIPAGFLIGRSQIASSMLNPIISLLRPVSPLAWLPLACWCSSLLTLPPSGPSSSARSGPWSSTPPWGCSACRRTT